MPYQTLNLFSIFLGQWEREHNNKCHLQLHNYTTGRETKIKSDWHNQNRRYGGGRERERDWIQGSNITSYIRRAEGICYRYVWTYPNVFPIPCLVAHFTVYSAVQWYLIWHVHALNYLQVKRHSKVKSYTFKWGEQNLILHPLTRQWQSTTQY